MNSISDDEVRLYLASLIRAARLEKKLSQQIMARECGISLRTYKRIELTGNGTIQNLILILRALNRIAAISLLFPALEQPRRISIVDRLQQVASQQLSSK